MSVRPARGQQIVVEQHLAAEPERVFAAWTSAEALRSWWWPHIADTSYELDARPGGRYEIRSEAAGFGARGEFVEVDPPRRLGMTWVWLNHGRAAPEERVTVDFSASNGGTLVTLRHQLDPIAGEGDNIRQGWTDVFARLARALTSASPDD